MNVVLGVISLTVTINLLLARQAFCHEHRHHFRHRSLNNCIRCPPGWGVIVHCNATQNTTCAPCSEGHYSGHHSYKQPCWSCSRCGEGLYIAHPCTSITDTVCDSCRTYRGPHNADFHTKCESWNGTDGEVPIHSSKNVKSSAIASSLPLANKLSRDLTKHQEPVIIRKDSVLSEEELRTKDDAEDLERFGFLSAKNTRINRSKLNREVFLIVIGTSVAIVVVAVVVRIMRKKKNKPNKYEGLLDENETEDR